MSARASLTGWSPFLEAGRDRPIELGRDTLSGRRGARWRLFAGAWLVFLLNPLVSVMDRNRGWAAVAGVVMIVAFALLYVLALPRGFQLQHRVYALLTPWVLGALALGVLPLSGEAGLSCFMFVAVAFLATYRLMISMAVLAGLVVLSWGLPYWVHRWGRDGGQQAVSIVLAAFVVLSMFQLLRSNRALVAAREDLAELAVLEERERFARDLHDMFGHSLTVITKKAELAHRLTSVDPQRAAVEIADVERLAREALADVRSTVTGYREVSLAGEMVSARDALAAAGIRAELPGSIESVPATYSGLFGWAVREGVTNVLRHSGAQTCRITVSELSVEVCDDGRGPLGVALGGAGNGLRGLRERVARAGGEVRTGSAQGGGFVPAVLMPAFETGRAAGP